MWLLVGLGNPGPRYRANRHNIGFLVIDEIASRCRAEAWRSRLGGDTVSSELAGERVILLKPMEFMNVSGHAVQRTAAFHQIDAPHILVVHDEIDLPLGRLKLKVAGGHGGHNGLRSMIAQLATPDFARIRCGVGRPAGPAEAADHVLADFRKDEQTEAEILIKEAADAVTEMVKVGPQQAMNRWNVRERQ